MTTQQYERYWSITLAYTDIYAEEFNKCLNVIIHFIDENKDTPYSEEKYEKLQSIINAIFPKSEPSIRKVVNTYVKLGFINPYLASYHQETPIFLRETNEDKKQTLFSKIVYENASFDRSVTNESEKREINFLIQTLAELKKIDKKDVLALMTTDITQEKKGYLTREELNRAKKYVEEIGFDLRKYNQVGHLWSVLKHLDNLVVKGNYVYFEEDAPVIDADEIESTPQRDPYLHLIYKNQLKEETKEKLQSGSPQCMVEKLDYPTLIASHIKPFITCLPEERYDPNNGLLLSKSLDALFDKGYISFADDGGILISEQLSERVKIYLENYLLDEIFLNSERKKYLEYHRSNVFKA